MSRRSRAALAALALATAIAGPARSAGEAPQFEVAIEPASATVGDLVVATLTLRLPPGDAALEPRFPDWSRGWGEVEVRAATPPQRQESSAGVVWTQRLTLAAFRTGRLELPAVAVAIPRQPPIAVPTPADLALAIRSVLPAERDQWQPRPPAPPVRLDLPAAFAWTAGALVAAALAASWLARRRGAAVATAIGALSPWDELERTLAAIDPRQAEAAHAALSLALRRYLGRAFAMPASQSSTSELGRRLGQRGVASDLVRRSVRLLREVDQVKFARAPAAAEQASSRVAEAREVAQAVARHLAPPPAPEIGA